MDEHVYKEEIGPKPSAFDGLTKKMLLLVDRIFGKRNKKSSHSNWIGRIAFVLILTAVVLFLVKGTYSKFFISAPESFVEEDIKPGDDESNSRYANDPTVATLSKKIDDLEEELKDFDLKNADLNKPVLDFDIDFKE